MGSIDLQERQAEKAVEYMQGNEMMTVGNIKQN
jgi:hypothetical protein